MREGQFPEAGDSAAAQVIAAALDGPQLQWLYNKDIDVLDCLKYLLGAYGVLFFLCRTGWFGFVACVLFDDANSARADDVEGAAPICRTVLSPYQRPDFESARWWPVPQQTLPRSLNESACVRGIGGDFLQVGNPQPFFSLYGMRCHCLARSLTVSRRYLG